MCNIDKYFYLIKVLYIKSHYLYILQIVEYCCWRACLYLVTINLLKTLPNCLPRMWLPSHTEPAFLFFYFVKVNCQLTVLGLILTHWDFNNWCYAKIV